MLDARSIWGLCCLLCSLRFGKSVLSNNKSYGLCNKRALFHELCLAYVLRKRSSIKWVSMLLRLYEADPDFSNKVALPVCLFARSGDPQIYSNSCRDVADRYWVTTLGILASSRTAPRVYTMEHIRNTLSPPRVARVKESKL